jgi:hypothetical protein
VSLGTLRKVFALSVVLTLTLHQVDNLREKEGEEDG